MIKRIVAPTDSRLKVIRGGRAMVREWKIPKPTVLVDTREQAPFPLLDNHPNWIGDMKIATLSTGDYSVEGMEGILALERKSMADAIGSVSVPENRPRFLRACERLGSYKHKAIIIEATYEDMKTPYVDLDLQAEAHPNSVVGTYDAICARWDIQVIYTSRDRSLATERAASWLSKYFTYWWLEQNGYERVLIDTDCL